jgi:hypothetical protein
LRFIAATEHEPRIVELGDLDRESAASLN